MRRLNTVVSVNGCGQPMTAAPQPPSHMLGSALRGMMVDDPSDRKKKQEAREEHMRVLGTALEPGGDVGHWVCCRCTR